MFTFLYPIGYQSAQFFRRALHYASGGLKFLRQSAQPPWGSVYIVIHRPTLYRQTERDRERKREREGEGVRYQHFFMYVVCILFVYISITFQCLSVSIYISTTLFICMYIYIIESVQLSFVLLL